MDPSCHQDIVYVWTKLRIETETRPFAVVNAFPSEGMSPPRCGRGPDHLKLIAVCKSLDQIEFQGCGNSWFSHSSDPALQIPYRTHGLCGSKYPVQRRQHV